MQAGADDGSVVDPASIRAAVALDVNRTSIRHRFALLYREMDDSRSYHIAVLVDRRPVQGISLLESKTGIRRRPRSIKVHQRALGTSSRNLRVK